VPWPFRHDGARAAGRRRESTAALEPVPPLYRSPTLRTLVSRLSGDVRHRILDLHPAVGANVEFFSRFSCRLQIVDLLGSLVTEDVRPLLADAGATFRRILPGPPDPYDVVLAWDVFNYLSRDQFRALAERLFWLCRPDALMLAFIATTKEISVLPLMFKIADEQTVHWQPRTSAVRAGPRYPPAEVERMTRGFAIAHSVLMRHGVQEYLFARRPELEQTVR